MAEAVQVFCIGIDDQVAANYRKNISLSDSCRISCWIAERTHCVTYKGML